MLGKQLSARVFQHVLRFGGKAHQHLAGLLALPHGSGDIRVFHQRERKRFSSALLELLCSRMLHAVIRRGRRLHDDVLFPTAGQHGIIQALRRGDGHQLHALRRDDMHRPREQRDLRAAIARSLRQGVAHLAGGIVGEVAHRINALHGGAGGDQHAQALHVPSPA